MTDAIVALHGFTGAPLPWPCLDADRTVALALAGHAPSRPVPPAWSLSDEIDLLAEQIEPLGAIHLIGYSMGGRLALALALTRPERIARLTLVSSHPGIGDPDERAARRRADERWCELLEQDGIEEFVDTWERQPMWRSQRRLPAAALDAQRRARLAHDPRALAAALRTLGPGAMPDLTPSLGRLTMPVNLIAGELDLAYVDHARRMASTMPTARVVIIDDAGHNPILEQPDALARALAGPPRRGEARS